MTNYPPKANNGNCAEYCGPDTCDCGRVRPAIRRMELAEAQLILELCAVGGVDYAQYPSGVETYFEARRTVIDYGMMVFTRHRLKLERRKDQ